ncbi:peptidoglycan-binding domain-containing protein [Mesobacterium pallidum]|uniref:peptidoglycan-binding domain-containing protein n=1 Tax=Mesobacterium pallidum TaxID=2872037 RepID=UPI001EE24435|nr:peptidoglycan-binding domain-containing protein [Mesobacterium pallidum]
MTHPWTAARDAAERRRAMRDRRALKDARLRDRLDLPLAALVAIGLGTTVAAGWLLAGYLDRNAVLDPAILRPLPDDRILSNLRDSRAPFVAATNLGDSDAVLLRADGRVAVLDPRTGLIADDALPPEGAGLSTPPVAMAASCPGLPDEAAACSDPGALSVLSEAGGILRAEQRIGGLSWRVLLDDSAWIGQAGTPVEQAEVTAWAATGDGGSTVVLAGAQGLGIHDSRTGRWQVPPGQSALLAAVEAGPVRLVPDGPRSWIISARGYGLVERGQLSWSADTDLAVQDLAIAPDGRRLAIVAGPCAPGDQPGCLTLSRLDGIDQLVRLVGDRDRFADLDQASLSHAMMQDGQIVTTGAAGVHAYDPEGRSWRQLVAGRIDSAFAAADGQLLVASAGTVSLVRGAEVSWSAQVDGGPFRQVLLAGAMRLGLGQDGAIRNLASNTAIAEPQEPLPPGARFETGAALGPLVLMAGPEGALLHDVEERRFNWLTPQELAGARPLMRPGVRLFGIGTGFALVDPASGQLHAVEITGDWPGQAIATAETETRLPAPLRSVTSDGRRLALVDATGRAWHYLRGAEPRPRIGNAMPAMSGPLRFAAGNGDVLFLASPTALARYGTADRGWSQAVPPPAGTRFTDLGFNGRAVFAVTDRGSVAALRDTGWAEVLGGPGAEIGAAELSDAAGSGRQVLFAGAGKLQAYDTVAGRFTRRYEGGAGAVRIVAPPDGPRAGGAPVWTSAGRLFHGSELVTDSLRDAWATGDGFLAERRGGAHGSHAVHYPEPGAVPTCTFLSAPAPGGTVLDAIALDSDRVLVATTAGYGIHDARFRRWIEVALPALRAGERLVLAGGALVALSPTGVRALPGQALAPIDSCAPPRLSLGWTFTQSGRAAALDPTTGAIALLADDGAISEWQSGTVTRLRAAPGAAPDPSLFLAAATQGNALLFATRDAVWRYDTYGRNWTRAAFDRTLTGVASVSFAEVTPGSATLSIWTRAGQSYRGVLAAPAERVELTELGPPELPGMPLPAATVTDLSARDGTWALGSGDRIALGRATDARLSTILTLTEGEAATPYTWADSLVLVAGPAARPTALTILPPGPAPGGGGGESGRIGFVYRPGDDRGHGLSTDGRRLWRIAANGRLLECAIRAGGRSDTGCAEILAAPLALSRDDITTAWRHESTQYIGIGTDLFTIDDSWRRLTPVAGPVVADGARVLTQRGVSLLLERPGGTLWRISGSRAEPVARDLRQLRAEGEAVVLDTGGTVTLLDPSGTLRQPDWPEGSRARSYDWQTGAFSALSPEGLVVDLAGAARSPLPVPAPDSVVAVLGGRGGVVYVQRRTGVVQRLEPGTCETGVHPGASRPCLADAGTLPVADRGLGRLTGLAATTVGPLLVFERGSLQLDREGRPEVDPRPATPVLDAGRGNAMLNTSDFRAAIRNLHGRDELAPAVIESSTLRRRQGDEVLARPMRPWEALDLGWMKWDRAAGAFVFSGPSGPVSVPPAAAIVDGRLLPARPGRALPLPGLPGQPGQGGFAWRTPEALWHHLPGAPGPTLVTRDPRPAPVAQQGLRFLFPGTDAQLADSGAPTDGTGAQRLSLGALTVAADARTQAVTATLSRTGGAPLPAFAARGFLHDDRRGLGHVGTALVTVTPVGLVPATGQLTGVEALPGGQVPQRLVTQGGLHAEMPGGSWLTRQGPGTWAAAASPLVPRRLGTIGARDWTVTAGGLEITSAEPWRAVRDGLTFASDRLLSMAGAPGQVVVVTALGTHVASGGAGLTRLGAPQAPVPALPLVAHAARPGQEAIYEGSGARREWTGANGWRPVTGAPPWVQRRAAETPLMRIDLASGALQASRAVTGMTGATRWVDFTWSRGDRFPFDIARVIAAEADALWIGTGMGLRRFGADGSPRGDLFDLAPGSAGGGRPAAVTRLGRPDSAPDRLLALSRAGDCAALTGGGLSAACPAGETLDRRFVLAAPLWSWVQTDGGPIGTYPVRDQGSPGTRPVRMTASGRWAHDDLAAWAECAPGHSELWQEGDILRQDGVSLVLPAGSRDLHCQPAEAELGGGLQLESGLYVTGAQPLASGPGGRLQPVPGDRIAALEDRARGRLALDAGRLRLRLGRAEGAWEHRTAADAWRALDWSEGLPALDRTRGIAALGDRLVRVTPAGLVTQDIRASGLGVDPRTYLPGVADSFDGLAGCQPARIEIADGRQHAVPARAQDRLSILCRDGVSYMGEPGARDIGALQPAPADAFATRRLIDAGGWVWTLDQPDPAGPPVVGASFRGEPMPVTAGRLPIDSFASLAAPFAGRVDLVTADGWRSYAGGLALADGARPGGDRAARAVTAVTADRATAEDGTSSAVLCTAAPGGAILRSAQAALRRVEACAQWQGQAGVWHYRAPLDGAAIATGQAANGPLMARAIGGGRFLDLVAIGLPRAAGDRLVIPTGRGTLTMRRDGSIEAYHQFDDPRGAYLSEDGTAIAITGAGRLPLDPALAPLADCTALGDLLAVGDVRLPEVELRDGLLHARVHAPGTPLPGAVTLDCDGARIEHQRRDMDVAGRARYQAQLRPLDQSTGLLRLQATTDARLLLTDGRGRATPLRAAETPGTLLALLPAADGRTMLVVYDTEVYQLDVDAALSQLAETRPVPAPPPAPAPPAAGTEPPSAPPPPSPAPGAPPAPGAAEAPANPAVAVTPPTSPAPRPDPSGNPLPFDTLSRDEITRVQTALQARGFYRLRIDGLHGPGTDRAVRAFQAAIGADQTGVLTIGQRNTLLASAP